MRLVFVTFAAHAVTDNVLISTPACVFFAFIAAIYAEAMMPRAIACEQWGHGVGNASSTLEGMTCNSAFSWLTVSTSLDDGTTTTTASPPGVGEAMTRRKPGRDNAATTLPRVGRNGRRCSERSHWHCHRRAADLRHFGHGSISRARGRPGVRGEFEQCLDQRDRHVGAEGTAAHPGAARAASSDAQPGWQKPAGWRHHR